MNNDNKKGLIYLASPYNHPDTYVMESRYLEAVKAVAYLMSQGYTVFSPIVHNHPIVVTYGLPRGWEYWKQYDETFLRVSAKMIIFTIPGYLESVGIKGEIEICNEIMIPIDHLSLEEVERGLLT